VVEVLGASSVVPSSSSFSFPDGLDVQPQFVSRRRDLWQVLEYDRAQTYLRE
jgi:hypothetical protein